MKGFTKFGLILFVLMGLFLVGCEQATLMDMSIEYTLDDLPNDMLGNFVIASPDADVSDGINSTEEAGLSAYKNASDLGEEYEDMYFTVANISKLNDEEILIQWNDPLSEDPLSPDWVPENYYINHYALHSVDASGNRALLTPGKKKGVGLGNVIIEYINDDEFKVYYSPSDNFDVNYSGMHRGTFYREGTVEGITVPE